MDINTLFEGHELLQNSKDELIEHTVELFSPKVLEPINLLSISEEDNSQPIVQRFTQTQRYIDYSESTDENGNKNVLMTAESDRNIGTPGPYMYGSCVYNGEGKLVKCDCSWIYIDEQKNITPMSLCELTGDGNIYAIINHDNLYYDIYNNDKRTIIDMDNMSFEELEYIQQQLQDKYVLLADKVSSINTIIK